LRPSSTVRAGLGITSPAPHCVRSTLEPV